MIETFQQFLEKYEGAKEERGIFFHGTHISNLKSILSNGLQPYPRKRAWDEDPNYPNSMSASRASYGGIYLTRNLGTATSVALHGKWKIGDSVLVVCVEGQPRSFVADEDDIAINAVRLRFANSINSYLAAELYWAMHLGVDVQFVEKYKKEYVENMLGDMKYKSKDRISPQLEVQLKFLFEDLWPIVVDRTTSYFPEENGTYWKSSWNRIYHNFTNKNDDAPPPPNPQEMENKFREKVDKITRTMKTLGRSTISFNQASRSLQPIGFHGSNKIVCIVEIIHSKDKDTPEIIKVHYGKLPNEFIAQYKEKRGPIRMAESRISTFLEWAKSQIPTMADLLPYADVEECFWVVEDIAKKFPSLRPDAGFFVKNGYPAEHAWLVAPDRTIIDPTHGQFDEKVPILFVKPNEKLYTSFHSYDKHHNPNCLHKELKTRQRCEAPGCDYKGQEGTDYKGQEGTKPMTEIVSPVSYQGGKQRIAPQIIDAMEINPNEPFYDLCCGSGAVSIELVKRGFPAKQIHMVDASPWGLVWQAVGQRQFDMNRFRQLIDAIPKDISKIQEHIKNLSKQPASQDTIYVYLILQAASFGGKSIWIKDNKWQNCSFRNLWTPTKTSNRRSNVNPMMPMPETLYQRMQVICDTMVGVNGYCVDINNIKPRSGTVYIDPPYQGTTLYGHTFDVEKYVKSLPVKCYVSEGKPLSGKSSLISSGRKKGGISGGRKVANEEWLSRFN